MRVRGRHLLMPGLSAKEKWSLVIQAFIMVNWGNLDTNQGHSFRFRIWPSADEWINVVQGDPVTQYHGILLSHKKE